MSVCYKPWVSKVVPRVVCGDRNLFRVPMNHHSAVAAWELGDVQSSSKKICDTQGVTKSEIWRPRKAACIRCSHMAADEVAISASVHSQK